MKKYLVLLVVCTGQLSNGMDNGRQSQLAVFAIPGMNGLGSSPKYVSKSTGIPKSSIVSVETPTDFFSIDLGQEYCMEKLEQTLPKYTSGYVLHATSQGTATALNYLAIHKAQQKKLQAAILEAPLASGNSAIHHTATHQSGLTFLNRLPFSDYWAPYLAKIRFPSYSPAGPQAIESIERIDTNAPIIIAHSKDDQQLPFQGACALYHGLRKNGNSNVYFIERPGQQHINLMQQRNRRSAPVYYTHIRDILLHHKLIQEEDDENEDSDLSRYQPDYTQDRFKNAYESLQTREKRHRYISLGMKVALGAAILKIAHWYLTTPKSDM